MNTQNVMDILYTLQKEVWCVWAYRFLWQGLGEIIQNFRFTWRTRRVKKMFFFHSRCLKYNLHRITYTLQNYKLLLKPSSNFPPHLCFPLCLQSLVQITCLFILAKYKETCDLYFCATTKILRMWPQVLQIPKPPSFDTFQKDQIWCRPQPKWNFWFDRIKLANTLCCVISCREGIFNLYIMHCPRFEACFFSSLYPTWIEGT